MPLTATAKILCVDRMIESHGGRIYPKSVIERAIKDQRYSILRNNPVGFYMRNEGDVQAITEHPAMLDDLQNVSHLLTNLELIDGWVLATVQTVNTVSGKLLEAATRKDDIAFRPAGTARLDHREKVCGYTFLTVNAFNPELTFPLPT